MNKASRAIALTALAVTCAACKNVAPDADQAAVIVDPDAASRAALQATVKGTRFWVDGALN